VNTRLIATSLRKEIVKEVRVILFF
jgi:hypothetical protein